MNMNKIKITLLSIFTIISFVIGSKVLEPITVDADTTEREYVGQNFCEEDSTKRVLKIAGYVLIVAKVSVPLIIIVVGTIDLFYAVIGKDSKVLTQKIKTLLIRIFLGVFIFFIPALVEIFFDMFNEASGEDTINKCVECMISPTEC